MKKLICFDYKKEDTNLNLSFDMERKNHKQDIENMIEILEKALLEIKEYHKNLIL